MLLRNVETTHASKDWGNMLVKIEVNYTCCTGLRKLRMLVRIEETTCASQD